MISSLDELEKFWNRKATLFASAFHGLAKARLSGGDYKNSFNELVELLRHTMILSNLQGRKRMLMEADAAKRRSRYDADGKTPLSSVVFEEAVEDLVSREPRLASSAEELSRLYNTDHVFGMALSIDQKLTERVQKALADAIRTGESSYTTRKIMQEIAPFTDAYANVVYRTNMNTNYTAGRFEQAQDPEVNEIVPAMEFQSLRSPRTRPNHAAAHGLVAGTGDSIWRSFSPPIGHQCQCSAEAVSVFELQRRGLIKNGHVTRWYPAGFDKAHPDKGFKVGVPSWEVA